MAPVETAVPVAFVSGRAFVLILGHVAPGMADAIANPIEETLFPALVVAPLAGQVIFLVI
jgi:hypothetical protein